MPREFVWKAFTEPERVARWWGPHDKTTAVVEMDVRPGGARRFVNRWLDGSEYPYKGVFREVEPPSRLVHMFIFDIEGARDDEALVTAMFEDLDTRTKLTSRTRFASVADLERAMAAGMTQGAIETWDRLEAELAQK